MLIAYATFAVYAAKSANRTPGFFAMAILWAGLGAIGVIVFPILLSLGIPKPLATPSFLMSVGAGLYFNSGEKSTYQRFLKPACNKINPEAGEDILKRLKATFKL